MPNQEHVDILKQGVQVWNKWRMGHLEIQPDLREINLGGVELSGVRLSRTDLRKANLSKATLRGAHLRRSRLNKIDLSEADLREAHLRGAANFSNARVGRTTFGDLDLRTAKGLETVQHFGPSSIDIDTIYKSGGNIPESFLRGAGVPDTFITYMRSLVGKPIDFYSCFISYSSKDQDFAPRLHNDLQGNGVRCWYAPEDLKWGEKIHAGIDRAIHFHDKLLLILSKHSIASGWVEREVKTTLTRERKEMRVVLFPVRIDKAVLDSPLSWATKIRHNRNIGDFTRWKEHGEYQKGLSRLLRDLKQEATTENTSLNLAKE